MSWQCSAGSCSVGVGKVKQVALSCLQACVLNLCNIHTKVSCAAGSRPFISQRELSQHDVMDSETFTRCLQDRLDVIFREENPARQKLMAVAEVMLAGEKSSVQEVLKALSALYSLCWDLVSQWGVHDSLLLGPLPVPSLVPGSGPRAEVDPVANRLYLHWPHPVSGRPHHFRSDDFLSGRPDDFLSGRPDDFLSGRPDDFLSGRPDDFLSGRPDDFLSGRPDDFLSSCPHDFRSDDFLSGHPDDFRSNDFLSRLPDDFRSDDFMGDHPDDVRSHDFLSGRPDDVRSHDFLSGRPDDFRSDDFLAGRPDDFRSDDFLFVVQSMLATVRREGRQPTETEFFLTHLAYLHFLHGGWSSRNHAVPLGTPGFRPHTHSHISLADPGNGHMMGTTRFSDWLRGVVVYVEHLARPRPLPVESCHVPSVLDLARVRLHVGSAAPTSYSVGRPVKDSGNFDHDFLKVVHLTAAAASAAFFQGVSEVKVAMESLSTSQALRYMRALRAQVLRSGHQFLSAAWNLNHTLLDDFDLQEPVTLTGRFDIAMRAVEITSLGGFDKVTWDGATSDTYPWKCIMYQLSHAQALTLTHEAHTRGLLTYLSGGFKLNEIRHAVHSGVDGIGIGGEGAQILHHTDPETGTRGPYIEENIPRILASRDRAARDVTGRGVMLLARLDSMYFEGSLSRQQDALRLQLFAALLDREEGGRLIEGDVDALLQRLADVSALPSEGGQPFLHRAKRLVEAQDPVLKEFSEEEQWEDLVRVLRGLMAARDEEAVREEYHSEPWLSLRDRYRQSQCPPHAPRVSSVRRASFCLHTKV